MGVDKDPKKSEEEYHYSEDQLGPDEENKEPKSKKLKALRKRLFIALGIIFAIYVVYKFLGTKPPTEAEQEAKPIRPVAVQPVQPTAEQQIKQSSSVIEAQVQSLAQQNLANNAQIQSLRGDVEKINNSVEQLQNTLNTLTTSLQSISAQAAQLQAQAAPGVAKRATVKSGTSSRELRPAPCCPNNCCATCVCARPCMSTCLRCAPCRAVFHLKAVVPGRAWLESCTGILITVKVGDPIRGYGIVKAINATQGWVGMSSGTVIRYGPNDS